jgi:hypothetical protein
MIGKYKGPRLDNRGTPLHIIGAAKAIAGASFDLACDQNNLQFEGGFIFPDSDALKLDWPKDRVCFLNPPFSQANEFFRRAAEQRWQGTKLLALYKSNNLETKTWQDWILPGCDWVLFLNQRTSFIPPPDYTDQEHGPGFSCALISYGIPMDRRWRQFGTIMEACHI